MRYCPHPVRSLSEHASAEVVTEMPGSARAQVSGRTRTLTSPQWYERMFGYRPPLASGHVIAGQTARFLRAVIPSYSDGLHCGGRQAMSKAEIAAGHPVLLGRAPLRRGGEAARAVRDRRSSRPTRTGS